MGKEILNKTILNNNITLSVTDKTPLIKGQLLVKQNATGGYLVNLPAGMKGAAPVFTEPHSETLIQWVNDDFGTFVWSELNEGIIYSGGTGGGGTGNDTLHSVTSRGSGTGNNVTFSGTSTFSGTLKIPSISGGTISLYSSLGMSTGYTAPTSSTLSQQGDVVITNPVNGQGLVFSGGTWSNQTIVLSGSGSVDLSGYYTKVQSDAKYLTGYTETSSLQDVVNRGNTATSLTITGSLRIPSSTGAVALYASTGLTTGYTPPSNLTGYLIDLLDTNIVAPQEDQILQMKSGKWKNVSLNLNFDTSNFYTKAQADGKYYSSSNPSGYISSYSETDTLASVTARGATSNSNITLGGVVNIINKLIIPSTGGASVTLFATTGLTTGYTAPVITALSSLTDVQLTNISTGQGLIWNGSKFVNQNITVDLSNVYSKTEADAKYYLKTNPSGYLSAISSSLVTTALGYTPVNPASLGAAAYLGASQVAGASTLVQRDTNGYIQNSYFYTSGGGSERNSSGLQYIAGFNSSDYYIRSYNSTALASMLGLGSGAYNDKTKLWSATHPNDFYISNSWDGTYWQLTSNHGSAVNVGRANTAGSVAWAGITGKPTLIAGDTSNNFSAANYFITNQGGYSGALSSAALQVYSNSNNAAFMSFHKGGYYAVNMGLDADNVFRIGGWSAAADRLQLDMSGNLTVAGKVTATSIKIGNVTLYSV